MKPCTKNRMRIAWLVLGELEAPQQKSLRAHLAECAVCRGYFEEMCRVAEVLTHTEGHEGVHAGEAFHQRIISKLRAEETRPSLAGFLDRFRWAHLNWRLRLSAGGTILLVIVTLFEFLRPASTPVTLPPAREVVSGPPAESAMAPTLSNYEMVAKLSSEKLDELLTEQGSRNLSPTPTYRAMALPMGTGAD